MVNLQGTLHLYNLELTKNGQLSVDPSASSPLVGTVTLDDVPLQMWGHCCLGDVPLAPAGSAVIGYKIGIYTMIKLQLAMVK